MSDLKSLLEAFVQRGDVSAMEEFVRQTRPRLLRAARRIGAAQDAEDTVQSAYYSLLRSGDLGDAPPLAWLLTTVVRVAYRRRALVRRMTEIARQLDRPASGDDPLPRLVDAERSRNLRAVIARLPRKYADIVVLRDLEGLSTGDAAELLGIPASTVATRLRRAHRLLRARLSPRLAWLGLCAPWAVQDCARATAPWLGGTMTTKTTIAMCGVVMAAGLVGYGTAHVTAATAPPTPRNDSTRRITSLESELATAQEEGERLRERLARAESAGGHREGPTNGVPAEATRKSPEDAVRSRADRLLKEAKAVEVPADVLEAARRADELLSEKSPEANEAVRLLARHGEDPFRAVVALLRSGRSGQWFSRKLIPFTFRRGLESLLIETAQREDLSGYAVGIAIGALEHADTPEVRDYLVRRIEGERNPTVFWYLAQTLGALHDPRGVRACANKLVFDDPVGADWIGYRRGLLHHIGRMGGPQALRALSDYVRDPRITQADDIMAGLNPTYTLDRKVCAELARVILASPRAEALSEEQLRTLANFVALGG